MNSSADLFHRAWDLHEAGDFAQAETLYRQFLEQHPDSADAWCFLGAACEAQGRLEEAAANHRQAIRLNPGYAAAHYNLGLVLEQCGKLDEAAQSFRQALLINPELAVGHNSLGAVLLAMGQFDEALLCFRHALVLDHGFAAARFNLADALAALGRWDEAGACCEHALQSGLNDPDKLFAAGCVFGKHKHHEMAIKYYRHALRWQPDHINARYNLSNSLGAIGSHQEAIAGYKQVVALDPGHVGAISNLGSTLLALDDVVGAIECFQKALGICPTLVEAHANLGTALKCQGRYADALVSLEEAIRLKPDFADARWNRALIWLLHGDFERGLGEYEWRWQHPKGAPRQVPTPSWSGGPLNGRSILLWTEQGLGDTIQFIRYAAAVKERGGHVVLRCQAALVPLLTGVRGIDQLMSSDASLPSFDVHAPLLSLPGILGTKVQSIPAACPYLRANTALVERWNLRLAPLHGFKTGIAWQGNPTYIYDRQRSVPLEQFAPIASVPGVQLVSLQKDASAATSFLVNDFGDELDRDSGAFMDTAAICKNLDLVICTDTALAHLAGALGVPVWVALPHVPDWRWLLDRDDSPWYPTMRLFRQKQPGDWAEVFHRISVELEALAMYAQR